MSVWDLLSHLHRGVREGDVQTCRSAEGTGLEDRHLRIGDIELVHKDVGPDKVF